MHDCVNCGCACYCHGDIDDIQVETIEYAYDHCEGCGCEEDPHEFDDDEFDDDERDEPAEDPEFWDAAELADFDAWREDHVQPCVVHRNAYCSRCHH